MPRCISSFSMMVSIGLAGFSPTRSLAGLTAVDARPTNRGQTQPTALQELRPGPAEAGRCVELIQAMKDATTPLTRLERALASARCVIVRKCAGPLSWEIHGIAPDRSTLASAVTTGQDCLDVAAEAMQHLPNGFDEDRRRILQDRIDMLRAFADVFAALAAADGSQRAAARLTKACVDLAVFVDDPNPGIAESAKLWQGVAYRRAGRADRTLNLLRPAIGSLHSSRVDFFTRMERCRALVDKGRFVAAQSLAMRLEKRVNTWLVKEDDSTRKRAADSLRRLRGDIYRQWAADLRAHGKEDRAKAADGEMRRALGDVSSPPTLDDVLLLDRAIAGLPEWKLAEPAPSTQAAGSSK